MNWRVAFLILLACDISQVGMLIGVVSNQEWIDQGEILEREWKHADASAFVDKFIVGKNIYVHDGTKFFRAYVTPSQTYKPYSTKIVCKAGPEVASLGNKTVWLKNASDDEQPNPQDTLIVMITSSGNAYELGL